MTSCHFDETGRRPAVTVHLHGRGEDAMHMDQRMRCAGRSLGAKLGAERDGGESGAPRVAVADRSPTDTLVATGARQARSRNHMDLEEHR